MTGQPRGSCREKATGLSSLGPRTAVPGGFFYMVVVVVPVMG